MRVAVFSDVHGNVLALEAVWQSSVVNYIDSRLGRTAELSQNSANQTPIDMGTKMTDYKKSDGNFLSALDFNTGNFLDSPSLESLQKLFLE